VKLLASFLISVFMAVTSISGLGGRAGHCCRPLPTSVTYTVSPPDIVRKSDCEIIRVLPAPNSVTLTIRRPGGPIQELEGFLKYKEYTTRDYGATWSPELPLQPVASTLAVAQNDLAQAPSEPRVLYRFVQEIGLYLRSDNGGKTWSLPHYSMDGLSREALAAKLGKKNSYTSEYDLAAIDPNNPHRIYAGVKLVTWGSLISFVGNPPPDEPSEIELPGVYVSEDGGDSWTRFTDALQNSAPLGISPSNPNVIYGQSALGVVKSLDGGADWTLVGASGELSKEPRAIVQNYDSSGRGLHIVQFEVDPGDPDVVFIVSNKGIYKSLDGGKSWCLLDLGFDELGAYRSLAINPQRREDIFVGTSMGIFYSKDRGCAFQKIYPK
jgi:hypothetical protein